jgi:hypothetical protein
MPDHNITFNPKPHIQAIHFPGGGSCFIVDDALLNPEKLVQLATAASLAFQPVPFSVYPGVQLPMVPDFARKLDEFFMLHVRSFLNARRTLRRHCHLAMVNLPVEDLQPRQWICHRDSTDIQAGQMIAASILYLFSDPQLGGTSFFVPKKNPQETSLLVRDSSILACEAFTQKYGIKPGYCNSSNEYFEKLYTVHPKWNRMIFYNGSIFHSSNIPHPEKMHANPQTGRLTLNGFFTCTRKAA